MAGIAGIAYVGYFGSARADAAQGSLPRRRHRRRPRRREHLRGAGSMLGVFLALILVARCCGTGCSSRISAATLQNIVIGVLLLAAIVVGNLIRAAQDGAFRIRRKRDGPGRRNRRRRTRQVP